MKIPFSKEEVLALRQALSDCPDAEALGTDAYVVDLYDAVPPLALELAFPKDGVEVLAAGELSYSEELDGWYMSGPAADAAVLAAALRTFFR